MVLQHYGVPTAIFTIVPREYAADELHHPAIQNLTREEITRKGIEPSVQYPLFIKPALEGSSKGISNQSRVTSFTDLWSSVIALREHFPGQDIVVEQFADGREFTISIIGTRDKARILGISEYIWLSPISPDALGARDGNQREDHTSNSKDGFQTYKTKMESFFDLCDAVKVDPDRDPEARTACEVALRAYRAVGCRDLGRVDVRSIGTGPDARPQILEVCKKMTASSPFQSLS